MSVIVIQYVTLDGVAADPESWVLRHGGPQAFAGDKFGVGEILDRGVLLLGRGTWQLFAERWPGRDTPFARKMNAADKLVASRTLTDVSGWDNSRLLDGDLVDTVKAERRDVVVMGSLALVRELAARDLVDEWRLRVIPVVLGESDADDLGGKVRLLAH